MADEAALVDIKKLNLEQIQEEYNKASTFLGDHRYRSWITDEKVCRWMFQLNERAAELKEQSK